MCNRVNYKVKEVHGKQREKVIHLNNAKRYVERETDVCALTVVADDHKLDQSSSVLHVEDYDGFKDSDLQDVLGEYKDILTDNSGMTSVVKMDIRLEPGAKVIFQMPYRLPDRSKEGVRRELDDLIKSDIVETSESTWASPLVPVAKPIGRVHVCVDFCRLNSVTSQVQTYIPCLDDILDKAGQASKMDLSKCFYQIVLSDEAKELTNFVSPFGKYQFKSMSNGGLKMPLRYFRLLWRRFWAIAGFFQQSIFSFFEQLGRAFGTCG